MKANKNQYYEGQICNAPILFPTCSMCPSQGAYNFLGYQPTYWQYMDKLVYWAGSASEGIIIPPPAGSIDAAHQSGVKVLGQVFFPPYAFGGNQAWVRQMLTKENGVHIYAKKLYEIAKYIGFDGWFINEESGGATSAEWADFIKDFNKFADDNGDTQMEIQWYNARRAPDVEILKTHKNTSQFLEYGGAGDYRNYASQLGCTEEETFSKIYGGVQVAASGHTNFIYHLNAAMPTDGHVGSLDFFCPEEKTWKDNVRNLLGKNDTGPDAYNAINRTFEYEMQMWTNYEGDPSVIAEKWPGVSGRVLERSVINSMPFTTSFCVGVGKHRFVEGEKVATQDWYHSGVQSIMPTWRYWFENKGNGSIKIDWDDAWNFGSSLKVDGGNEFTKGDHLWRLYKTQIAVNGGTLRLVYKASANSSVEVKLSTSSSVNPDATLANPTTTTKNGWTIAEYDLSSLNGKTIYMIALNLKTSSVLNDYKFSLGELSVLPANYAPAAVEVKNLATTSVLGNVQGDARLTWDFDYTADFDHFDIYKENEDGTQTMVGQTRDEAFYVPTFQRKDNESYVKFIVMPIMKDMRQQKGKSIVLDFPQATAPVVSFTISNSYLKVGESSTITANGTGNPTAFKWTLPEGLKLANGFSLTDQTITVVAEKVGKQRVSVEVTNAIGTSTTSSNILDVMTEEEYKNIFNVVYQKKVLGYSGSTNSQEVPDKIIDGETYPYSKSDKWCNVSADNWVTFDLQSVYRIYSFKIFDGNAGPESGVDQIDSYQILLSEDNEHWTTVVDTYNRQKESVKTDYIAPMRARYVKLVPHVNGILRIWEFEVYGKKDNSMKLSTLTNNVTMNAGESYNINVTYDLGEGATKADKFECVATSKNGNVTIGTIKENVKKNTFVIPVTAKQRMGDDVVTIRVVNGDDYEEIAVQVEVDATTQPNVLKGKTAEVRHYENDYSFEAAFKKYDVSGLTDGNKAEEALTDIEAPSTHRDDVWVIFTAPEGKQWDLSKVVVNIPNENYAENDNNEKNYVNKDVKIAVGDDLTRMNTVKTFSGLKKVSELSYIFPESVKTKYLAVICNLYVYSLPSMAEVSAYEQFADPTAINNATVQNAVKGIYTVNGTKLNALQKGLNIVKFADGTVQKVLVK